MLFSIERSRLGQSCLAAAVLLVGCTPAAVPTASVRPASTAPATGTTAATTGVPTQNPTPAPTPSAQPQQTPTPSATTSPASGDSLAALFATLAPVLAPFTPGSPGIRSREEVIAQLELALGAVPDDIAIFIQEEIDRYTENGLVERGFVALGTTPAASITVDRFASEAGAAADFPERETGCDELAVPGTELVDIVAKRCNAPAANSLYVIAHRGDLVVTVEVLDLPEQEAIEPVVATLAEIFRAIEGSLTR